MLLCSVLFDGFFFNQENHFEFIAMCMVRFSRLKFLNAGNRKQGWHVLRNTLSAAFPGRLITYQGF